MQSTYNLQPATRMLRSLPATCLLLVSLLLAAPAMAMAQEPGDDQTKPPQGSPQKPAPQTTKPKPTPTPKLPIAFRAFGAFEATQMTAKQTFESFGGSSMVPGFAVGGDVMNLLKKVFVRVGVSKGSVDGTRGFVDDNDQFISNGIPLKLGITNVELAVGWRAYLNQRVAWYAAVGANRASNSQESPDGEAGDNDTVTGRGYVALFGFEFGFKKPPVQKPGAPAPRPIKRQLFAGFEVAYRSVPGILGESGGSEDFQEDNLGGVAARVMFGMRFKK